MTLKEQALALYKTAFPDDPDDYAADFINRFFEKNCRYILKDDRLVSMLFLLGGRLIKDKKSYPVLYLYAAATLPEYRGNGLMAELIEKSKLEAKEKGAFLLTKPASESLFGYYEKFGFKTAVFSADRPIKKQNYAKPLKEMKREEYETARNKLLKDTPYITLDDTNFALSFFTLFGDDDSVAAVDITEDPPFVKEFITRDEKGTDRLLSSLDKTEALFRIKGDAPFAMIIAPKGEATCEKIHFSLALD